MWITPQATNTPFRFWKTDAHSEGGTHNPLIITWPAKIKQAGLRNQYGHVIDILPTTLELVGLKAPEKIREIQQDTIQGISLAYAVNNADAASKRNQQYYYIFGSRAIYKDGWKAAFAFEPKVPLLFNNYSVEKPGANDWKLYNIEKDFNERTDLSKKYPQKLEELKALFEEEARRNNLYPLITWDDVIQGALKQRQHQAQNKH